MLKQKNIAQPKILSTTSINCSKSHIPEPHKDIQAFVDRFAPEEQELFMRTRLELYNSTGFIHNQIDFLDFEANIKNLLIDTLSFGMVYLNYPKLGPEKLTINYMPLPDYHWNGGNVLGTAMLSLKPFQTSIALNNDLIKGYQNSSEDVYIKIMNQLETFYKALFGSNNYKEIPFLTAEKLLKTTVIHETLHAVHLLLQNRLGEMALIQRNRYYSSSQVRAMFKAAGFEHVSAYDQSLENNIAELLPELLLKDHEPLENLLVKNYSWRFENYVGSRFKKAFSTRITWDDLDKGRPLMLFDGTTSFKPDPNDLGEKFKCNLRIWLRDLITFTLRRWYYLGYIKDQKEEAKIIRHFNYFLTLNQFDSPELTNEQKTELFESEIIAKFLEILQYIRFFYQKPDLFKNKEYNMRKFNAELKKSIETMQFYYPEIIYKYPHIAKWIKDIAQTDINSEELTDLIMIYASAADKKPLLINQLWQIFHDLESPKDLQNIIVESIKNNITRLGNSNILHKEDTLEKLHETLAMINADTLLNQQDPSVPITVERQKELNIDLTIRELTSLEKNGDYSMIWDYLEQPMFKINYRQKEKN